MAKKSDGKEPERPHHAGSVVAEDDELTLWLNRLWARNEPPERIELWQMFGRNKDVRGEMIHHEDFPPPSKRDIEQVNRIANELMAAAQNDCDSVRKESWYQLAVLDKNRKASPLVRRIGPLQTKRTYAIKSVKDSGEEGDDEDGINAQSLALRYIKEGYEQVRWEKGRNDRVVEGMLLLQDNIIKNQQVTIDRFFEKVIASFEKQQEAEDRRVQRDILLEKEKFKLGLMKDGIRTARNLLPGLFGPNESPESGASNGHAAASNGSAVSVDHGQSRERVLVDNFLHDCEEAKLDIALFGDCEIREGKMVQVTPGIFTLKQFYVLAGVRAGRFPASALDDLMPKSGHENSITEDQIKRALDAGVTEGIGMALLEILSLRRQAKDAAAAVVNANTNGTTGAAPGASQ